MTVVDARSSKFKIGSGPVFDGIMSLNLTGDDKNQLSFSDIQSGDTKEFTLVINTKVDMASGGLWKAVYDAAVADSTSTLTWMPYGNTTASSSQPHVVMTGSKVDGKPPLSIEASLRDKAVSEVTFQVEDWELDDGA